MLEINDIRKGNKISFYGNEVVTVYETETFGRTDGVFWVKVDGFIPLKNIHFKGVDITKDILKEIGFVDNNVKMSGYSWLSFFVGDDEIRITKANDYWSLTSKTTLPPTKILKNVKFIHEVQNFITDYEKNFSIEYHS